MAWTKLSAVKKSLPDSLAGKVFVITGTTSGTGYVAAQTMAELGADVILLNRPSARLDASLAKLRTAVPEGKFHPIACNLQDFASVRSAAAEIRGKWTAIYCLANNAGIMGVKDEATVDGYDTTMQTNHLSHFLLTAELFPLLAKGVKEHGDARIVQHSSGGRHGDGQGKIGREGWGLEEKYYGKNGGNLGGDEMGNFTGPPFERYFQSKLANSVFMHGLDEKLRATPEYAKIRSVACQPGIATTSLSDHLLEGMPFFMKPVILLYGKVAMQTPEQGAIGLIRGMAHEEVKSGVLYGPLNQTKGPAVENKAEKYEVDAKAIQTLWSKSEEAVGREARRSWLE